MVKKSPLQTIKTNPWALIKLIKVLILTTISQPIIKYKYRESLSNFPVKKSLKSVPANIIKIMIENISRPEWSYNVIKHTGAYEPAIR